MIFPQFLTSSWAWVQLRRPSGSDGTESACRTGDPGFISRSGRSSGKGTGTPVFFPGESQGQRSLVGYSSQGHKESGMTEQLTRRLRPTWNCWSGRLRRNRSTSESLGLTLEVLQYYTKVKKKEERRQRSWGFKLKQAGLCVSLKEQEWAASQWSPAGREQSTKMKAQRGMKLIIYFAVFLE